MKNTYKQHRRQIHPKLPEPHDTECLVHHCEKEVPQHHGFKLCERHLAKAWAAYELANGRPQAPNNPEETINYTDPTTPGAVYFIRIGELLKIGWTTNINNRMHRLVPDAVLHVQPGTRQDEHQYHQQFKDHLAKGKEWFHMNNTTMQMVEELRTPINV